MSLQFYQDYRGDLGDLLEAWKAKEPFAFTRFGDGEAAVLIRREQAGYPPFIVERASERWRSDQVPESFRELLDQALRCDAEGYYLGLLGRRGPEDPHAIYLHESAGVPMERRTFAEIFSYNNYHRMPVPKRMAKDTCIVTSSPIPDNEGYTSLLIPTEDAYELDPKDTVEALLEVDRPILVAAGPLANVIVHQYWLAQTPSRRQPIIDIGSALDPWIHGSITRGYQHPKNAHRKREYVWHWKETA